MNQAEQTRRLKTFTKKELVALKRNLDTSVADIEASIRMAVIHRETGHDYYRPGYEQRMRAKLITRKMRQAEVDARLAEVLTGAPVVDQVIAENKETKRVLAAFARDIRYWNQYIAVAERSESKRGLESFKASLAKVEAKRAAFIAGEKEVA